MKNNEARKHTRLLIMIGIVLVMVQITVYLLLTQRIQQGEERIYTDMHQVKMDVIQLKEDMQ